MLCIGVVSKPANEGQETATTVHGLAVQHGGGSGGGGCSS